MLLLENFGKYMYLLLVAHELFYCQVFLLIVQSNGFEKLKQGYWIIDNAVFPVSPSGIFNLFLTIIKTVLKQKQLRKTYLKLNSSAY